MKAQTTHLLTSVVIVTLLMPGAVVAQDFAYLPGMLLGRGYDAIRGEVKSDCLTFTSIAEPANPQTLQNTTWNWQFISSSSQLFDLLHMDASASLNLGFASASDEFDLLSETTITNFSVNLLASAIVEKNWQFVKHMNYTGNFDSLLSDDPESFYRQCGSHYVSGVLYGGVFYAVLTATTSSQMEHDKAYDTLSGAMNMFSLDGTIAQETLSQITSLNLTSTGFVKGGLNGDIPLTPDQLSERFLTFPSEVSKGGVPIRVLLSQYPENAHVPPSLGAFVRALWDYQTVAEEIDFVIENPEQYYMVVEDWMPTLRDLRAEAEESIATLHTAIANCQDQPNNCAANDRVVDDPRTLRESLPPRYQGVCGTPMLPPSASEQWTMDVNPLGSNCGGDNEMGGNHPSITITSELTLDETRSQLNIATKVRMVESTHDHSCFEARGSKTFGYVNRFFPGCFVNSTNDFIPREGNLSQYSEDDNWEWTTYENGNGLVQRAECRADTKGDDDGEIGCKNITFDRMQVSLTHEEERMGPNELEESAEDSWENHLACVSELRRALTERSSTIAGLLRRYEKSTGETLIVVRRPLTYLWTPTRISPKFGTLTVVKPNETQFALPKNQLLKN